MAQAAARLHYTPSRLIVYTQFRLFCLFVEFFNPGNSRGNRQIRDRRYTTTDDDDARSPPLLAQSLHAHACDSRSTSCNSNSVAVALVCVRHNRTAREGG